MSKSAQEPVDRGLAGIAARQHGVVALAQVRALGMSASGVRARVGSGRLHRIHAGVYAVGHASLSVEGRWMAAVLACGPDAVLSHWSAAALWDLRPAGEGPVHVVTRGRAGRSREGIVSHRAAGLAAGDVDSVCRIPATSVARTLVDLAALLDVRAVQRLFQRAEMLRLLDPQAVEAVVSRVGRRPGTRALRAVLAALEDPAVTRSELEARFLALCRRAGIDQPRVNAWLELDGGGVEVDFLWRAARLVVETDGHALHRTRRAFERDRRRDQRMTLAGWRVVRFTWRQVVNDPAAVMAALRGLLNPPALASRTR